MRVRPWHQTVWDWRAAAQFICGGTGTGLMLFTALASYRDPAWLWRTGLLALAFVAVGLFFVWIKLGRKLRAVYVILNPRTSWMTREALFSVVYLVAGGLAILLASPPLALAAALFGLGYLYSQARILHASRGIPAWRVPAIVPLIVATGLTEGAALLLGASVLFGGAGLWLLVVLLALLGARWAAWSGYLKHVTAPGTAPLYTAEVLSGVHARVLSLGHVLPLLLAALAWLLPVSPAVVNFTGLLLSLSALYGGWLIKFTIIARAAYNQGFAIARTPARTPGTAGPGAKPGW